MSGSTAKQIRTVADIIDIEYLQRIQDSLGRVTGITTAILDPDGVPLTRATNLFAFCAMMQASPTGVAMCIQTNGQLVRINLETRGPAVCICPNSGLKTAAVPIFLNDQYLGSWLIGQLRTDRIDMDLIERTAIKAGLAPEEAKRNISLLPVISESEFEAILDFLTVITQEIIQLTQINATLDEKNQALTALSQQLDLSLSTFREFIDLADVGVNLVDLETNEILLHNAAFTRLDGNGIADATGKKCYELAGGEQRCENCSQHLLLGEDGEPGEPVVREVLNETTGRWIRMTSRAIRWVNGRLAQMTTYLDITDRKQEEERVSYLAYYDQRLGIPNGMKLFADLNGTDLEHAYMVCFDIQGLRKINDAYGREFGDKLLYEITHWLTLHSARTLYRVEGDEFALLVTQASQSQAMESAQELWDCFEHAWVVEHGDMAQGLFVSVSLGMWPLAGGYASYDAMLNHIERILSAARQVRRPLVYDSAIDEELHSHLRLELSLRDCVLNNMKGFSVHYQPIANPVTGHWMGMEALCRWTSPELGQIAPPVFIGQAEQMGLIGLIDGWVLNQALAQAKAWGLDQKKGFVLDVNLSPIELSDSALPARVESALERHGYPAEKLNLEITESAEVQFTGPIMESLKRLRSLGVSLSLDDFGTGYANFSSLKNLPVTVVKTDRSFAERIEDEIYMQNTMQTIVELAHAASMRVIAEGVETREQVLAMIENGVDYFQGYYFSKPLSAKELKANLKRFSDVETASAGTLSLKALSQPGGGYVLGSTQYRFVLRCCQELLETGDADLALGELCRHLHASSCTLLSGVHTLCVQRDGPYCASLQVPVPGLGAIRVTKNAPGEWSPSQAQLVYFVGQTIALTQSGKD